MAHLGGDCHVLFGKGPAFAFHFMTGVDSEARDLPRRAADLNVGTTKLSSN
jgi:hypothetical protein